MLRRLLLPWAGVVGAPDVALAGAFAALLLAVFWAEWSLNVPAPSFAAAGLPEPSSSSSSSSSSSASNASNASASTASNSSAPPPPPPPPAPSPPGPSGGGGGGGGSPQFPYVLPAAADPAVVPGLSLPWNRALGHVCAVLLGCLLVPVSRNSLWVVLFRGFGTSYTHFDRAIRLHRAVARCLLAAVGVHGGAWVVRWCLGAARDPAVRDVSGVARYLGAEAVAQGHAYGIAAGLCMLVMMCTSFEWVRRRNFEAFYFTHHLFLAVLVLACIHVYIVLRKGDDADTLRWRIDLWWYLLPGFLTYLVDRALRFVRSRVPTELLQLYERETLLDVTRLELERDGDDARGPGGCLASMRGATNVPEGAVLFAPGQYAFVCIPQLSGLEWHPFSLSSSPIQAAEHGSFSFHIFNMGPKSWAGRLYAFAQRYGADPNSPQATMRDDTNNHGGRGNNSSDEDGHDDLDDDDVIGGSVDARLAATSSGSDLDVLHAARAVAGAGGSESAAAAAAAVAAAHHDHHHHQGRGLAAGSIPDESNVYQGSSVDTPFDRNRPTSSITGSDSTAARELAAERARLRRQEARKHDARRARFASVQFRGFLEVKVDGPYGGLDVDLRGADTLVCVAGGIGITPVMSLLSYLGDVVERGGVPPPYMDRATRTCMTLQDVRHIHLVWAVRFPKYFEWFSEELNALQSIFGIVGEDAEGGGGDADGAGVIGGASMNEDVVGGSTDSYESARIRAEAAAAARLQRALNRAVSPRLTVSLFATRTSGGGRIPGHASFDRDARAFASVTQQDDPLAMPPPGLSRTEPSSPLLSDQDLPGVPSSGAIIANYGTDGSHTTGVEDADDLRGGGGLHGGASSAGLERPSQKWRQSTPEHRGPPHRATAGNGKGSQPGRMESDLEDMSVVDVPLPIHRGRPSFDELLALHATACAVPPRRPLGGDDDAGGSDADGLHHPPAASAAAAAAATAGTVEDGLLAMPPPSTGRRRVEVVSCGPPSMLHDVWNAAARLDSDHCQFSAHESSFFL